MKKSVKTVAVALMFVAVLAGMSSCNRGGYGCPYELKAPVSLFSLAK
ncbi:MAG: hypothetical protein U0V54_07000 [Saprospiraceae bacterium]|nr:hypothetical protein [Saprospiraceae bacterium]